MSKGLMVYASEEHVDYLGASVKTFSVPISAEMAPQFHIVVYHTTSQGELVTDSHTVTVDPFTRHEVGSILRTGGVEK